MEYNFSLAFTLSKEFHKSRRPVDDPVKRARAVWKLRALKFNMAAAMNFFIPNVEEFFQTILSLFNQSNACLELQDGDQAELISRRLEQYEQTLRVMYQRLNFKALKWTTSGTRC